MKKYFPILVFTIALFFSLSCNKKTIICEDNCYLLELRGTVINGITKIGEPNVPLIIERGKPVANIFANYNPVKEFKSSDNGLVSTSIFIDSSMFNKDYYLRVWVKKNANFIAPNTHSNFEYLHNINSNNFKNINFIVYPKANLIIKIKRIENDSFLTYSINGSLTIIQLISFT